MSDDRRNNDDVARLTIDLWHKVSPIVLTPEDLRQIVENIGGFFSLLEQWDTADRPSATPSIYSPTNFKDDLK